MKNFLTVLAIVAMSILPSSLWAKTVNFTIDNPAAAYLINTSNGSYIYFNGQTSIQVEVSENVGIQVNTNDGFELNGITVDGNTVYGAYISPSDMPDGSTVSITTKEKQAKVIYVVANPAQVSLRVNYSDVYDAGNMVDGKWTVTTTNEYASMDVNCADGYVIKSLTNSAGDQILSSYQLYKSTASVYMGSIESGETLTIECGKLADMRTTHVSVEVVDGSASLVSIMRNGEYSPIPESEFSDIALNPESELPLAISAMTYGKSLYKVEVNGVAQTPQGSTFLLYNLQNGDKISVYPNFPDVNVPVSFTFTNPGTEGAISVVRVDSEIIPTETWSAAGFSVKLGSTLGIDFNMADYNITSVTKNGNYESPYGVQTAVSTDEALNFTITATKLRDYNVKIYYTPGAIKVYRGYGTNDPVELPEGSDEIDLIVSPSNNLLNIEAAEGYIVTEIIDETNNVVSSPISVTRDMELVVYTEEFIRNLNSVIYLEEGPAWQYAQVSLSSSNYSMRKDIPLTAGYNFIAYAAQDIPFGLGFYPNADVYYHGEKIENVYGTYPALQEMTPNSVIKVFTEGTEVPTYKLTITNKNDVSVVILADYVTPIESNEATVFGPTDVEFLETAKAVDAITIKVNGQEITPDAEDRLIAHIAADSDIEITKNVQSTISEINFENADAPVYNLQGVRVNNPGHGIFIKNGKKIIL